MGSTSPFAAGLRRAVGLAAPLGNSSPLLAPYRFAALKTNVLPPTTSPRAVHC